MINLAVIEIKDIIKYLVRTIGMILIVIILTKYFSSLKTNIRLKPIELKKQSFLSCINTIIPMMRISKNPEEKTSLYKLAFGTEIRMMDNIETKNIPKKEENNIEKVDVELEEDKKVDIIEEIKTNLKTEVQESNVPENFTDTYGTVKIKNGTNIKLTEKILEPNVKINTKNIIIYHTHTCESYTQSEKYKYKASGNFRTTDKERSVVRVGTELTKYMKNYGYNVIHDMTLYDYPSYNGSYDRSYDNVGKLLDENPGTEVLFDLHRDAIADSSYAPKVKIGDEYAAQLLFVIGSNGGGGKHDNWEQNLKFAIKIQEKANEMYPGLFKPIILRNSRYNQQLAKGASIIEVGATGNTLDECLVSMKYLSKVLSEI